MKSNLILLRNAICVSACVLVLGCRGGEKIPELTQVQGTIKTVDGDVLPNIKVTFLPDPEKEVLGRPATGNTDAQGKFVLHYNGDENKPGTAVGWNRVILLDITATETSRDPEPTFRRFHSKYLVARETDLRFEIKSGEAQTIELVVEGPE